MKPGVWLVVASGWKVAIQGEAPACRDLVATAPNNPVYIQLGYEWVVMTPAGFKALNIIATPTCHALASSEMQVVIPRGIDGGGGSAVAIRSTAFLTRISMNRWKARRNFSANSTVWD